jgi:hypothetical protein
MVKDKDRLNKKLMPILVRKTCLSKQVIRNALYLIRKNNPGVTMNGASQEFSSKRGFNVTRYLDSDDKRSLQNMQYRKPKIKTKTVYKTKKIKYKKLINFSGGYPHIFYNKLENEINLSYGAKLPNATLILVRKLIENLVYNLLEYKFSKRHIKLYYNVSKRRANDFSVLLDNLKTKKKSFGVDEQHTIENFLKLVHPFRRDANSTTHKIIEYVDKISELNKYKIADMVQLLLILISKNKK